MTVTKHARFSRTQQSTAVACTHVIKAEKSRNVVGTAFQLIQSGSVLRQIVLVVGGGCTQLCNQIRLDRCP